MTDIFGENYLAVYIQTKPGIISVISIDTQVEYYKLNDILLDFADYVQMICLKPVQFRLVDEGEIIPVEVDESATIHQIIRETIKILKRKRFVTTYNPKSRREHIGIIAEVYQGATIRLDYTGVFIEFDDDKNHYKLYEPIMKNGDYPQAINVPLPRHKGHWEILWGIMSNIPY